jgi:methionyl aminopeptidase
VISLKGADELARMRQAGRIVALALEAMAAHVAPGVRTIELDEIARRIIASHGAEPSFLGYPSGSPGVPPFPASVCVSINNVIVHGQPGEFALRNGDIVSLDCGCVWRGYHADAATTIGVGSIDGAAQNLMEVTHGALVAGIGAVRPGAWLWDVIQAVQTHVEGNGLAVVREYQGHGIGRQMHEPPSVPNFLGEPRPPNVRLRPGLTFALEPMVTAGTWRTRTLADGWTVVTQDGSLAAHFEHTLAVAASGVDILTVP